ncbi:uncharacterized protein [Montipora capricornis]|uniref:uncharacterized protein isoform X2 n=1 Tax=Montipora capricornis TaxID=246305 RepID=UPI0035F18902
MFSRGAIFLAVLLVTLQDEVFAQTTTIVGTPSSQSAFVSSQSAFVSSQSAFVTTSTQQAIAPTASTVTGTESTPTTEPPTTPTSEIPDSNKTCGTMTVTIYTAQERSKDDVNTTIQNGLFNDSMIYEAVKITNMNTDGTTPTGQIVVTFEFCLVFKSGDKYIEDLAKAQFKILFNTTKIDFKLEETGVDSEWKPVEGECNKCSDGGGGPFNIERKCTPKSNSCNGLQLKRETDDCVTYCPDSGHDSGADSPSSFEGCQLAKKHKQAAIGLKVKLFTQWGVLDHLITRTITPAGPSLCHRLSK